MPVEKNMPSSVKRILIGSGALFFIAPLLGVLGTVIGMSNSFATLEKSGTADMTGLSSSISTVLVTAAAGLGIGFLALIVFVSVLIYWLIQKSSPDSPPE